MKGLIVLMMFAMVWTGVCGMAKSPAVGMVTLQQLAGGEVSLWRYMASRTFPAYLERKAEVIAKIAGIDAEALKALYRGSLLVTITNLDEGTVTRLASDISAEERYGSLKRIVAGIQEVMSSLMDSEEPWIEELISTPQGEQALKIAEQFYVIDTVVLNFERSGELPLAALNDSLAVMGIDNVEPWLTKLLVQFMEAPLQQRGLFERYQQEELSGSELTAELLQLIEAQTEMMIFSATEMEEIRQALQLGHYAGGIFGDAPAAH